MDLPESENGSNAEPPSVLEIWLQRFADQVRARAFEEAAALLDKIAEGYAARGTSGFASDLVDECAYTIRAAIASTVPDSSGSVTGEPRANEQRCGPASD